ncbi:MAG: serpin family protein [Polyangiales bacterium]
MPRRLPLFVLLLACGAEAAAPAPVTRPNEVQPLVETSPTAVEAAPPPRLLPTDLNGSSQELEAEFATGSNALSFSLFAHSPRGNVVLGGGSVAMALAMTWAGARGTTAAELAACAGFGPNTHAAVAGLLQAYNEPSSPLFLANRLYMEETYNFEAEFGELMRARYAAPFEPVDFRGASGAARTTINDWVASQTRGQIRDLLAPPAVSEATRLVLVNATYFLGRWATPFDARLTAERSFSVAEGSETDVPMMIQNAELGHAEIDGVQLVELPYEGGRFSMVIVVPKARFGLHDVEMRLSPAQWTRWVGALSSGPTSLTLPRFEVRLAPSISLVDTLQELGVESAFDERAADFQGMAQRLPSGAGLFVSDVLHQAFVRVDEAGTEAAAATAVVMGDGAAAPAPPFVVRADQPFLFFVRDIRSGLILFTGRVVAP